MMKNHMPKKKWVFLIVDIDYAGVSSGHKTVRSEITTINNDVWSTSAFSLMQTRQVNSKKFLGQKPQTTGD